jgi:hypothetical protein
MSSALAKKAAKRVHELQELFELEHLGLTQEDVENVENPFDKRTKEDIENPHIHLIKLMLDPKYFGFTCKHVLNIDPEPFQLVILDELWHRKYPMLIASRGGSKSFMLALYSMLKALFTQGIKIVVVGSAFRQAKVVFEYCEAIWFNAPILRDIVGGSDRKNGPKRDIDRCMLRMGQSQIVALPLGDGTKIRGQRAGVIIGDEFACTRNSLVETDLGLMRIEDAVHQQGIKLNTGNLACPVESPSCVVITPPTDVYRVRLEYGFTIDCSDKHKIMTEDGFKLPSELIKGDRLPIKNEYVFPTNYMRNDDVIVNNNLAWLMGMLTSEGAINSRHSLQVHMTDKDCIERVNKAWKKLDNNINTGICSKQPYKDKLAALGLDRATTHTKKIPWSILQSPKEVVLSFLAGLYEGDGSCFVYKDRNKERIGVSYYTVSEQLARELQVLLYKFDILTSMIKRKSKISNNIQYMLKAYNANAAKLLSILNIRKWDKFRQIKVNYKKTQKPRQSIKVVKIEDLQEKDVLYDFYLPHTHSFYGNGFIQHNSIPKAVYQNVVEGFAAVSQSPVESSRRAAKIRVLKRLGKEDEVAALKEEQAYVGNQVIIAGTAYYGFNHFAEYWKEYKAIIESKGDPQKVMEIYKGKIPKKFNHKNYSIIRLPAELLPEDFMDEEHIARSQATTHTGIYQMEFGAVFASDSNGFFRRSLIESCVAKDENMTHMPLGVDKFRARLKGDHKHEYIYAIDPASEDDNFCVLILEMHENHRRIVYCWTTTREKHKERIKQGEAREKDFYSFCVRKIRDLMRLFPCRHIILDAQGGGRTISEAFHDPDKIMQGEQPIWEVVEEGIQKDTDFNRGLHILELVEFSKAEWVMKANHGMKKDFEDHVLLFPYFDSLELYYSIKQDKKEGREYDTLEDCVTEIEELKDELATIELQMTPGGTRERWDVPKDKTAAGIHKKGTLRKDRYTALLMANMAARQLQRSVNPFAQEYQIVGGFASQIVQQAKERTSNERNQEKLYLSGPEWFIEKMKNMPVYGKAIPRRRVF